MPVVEISALPQGDGIDVAAALTSVTRAVADVLGEEPSGTWATWQTLDPGTYVEGEDIPTRSRARLIRRSSASRRSKGGRPSRSRASSKPWPRHS